MLARALKWCAAFGIPSTLARPLRTLEFYIPQLNAETDHGIGRIDYVEQQSHRDSWFLMIRGWIFHLHEAITSVYVIHHDQEFIVPLHGLDRPDVQEAFPGEPRACMCGFWARVPIRTPGLPSYALTLRAQTESGKIIIFKYISPVSSIMKSSIHQLT